MGERITTLFRKSCEDESLQAVSRKLGISLVLFDAEGKFVAKGGSTLAEGVMTVPERVTDAACSVPIRCGEEVLGTLCTMDRAEHSQALLAAAAHVIETSLLHEAEIEDMSSEIVQVYDELATLYSLSTKLGSALELDEICQHAIEECRTVLQTDTVVVMLVDDALGRLVTQACSGNCVVEGWGEGMSTSTGIVGEVFMRKAPLVLEKPDVASGLPLIYPCSAALCIPLVTDNRNIGMMIATDKCGGTEFYSQQIKLMAAISSEIAAAIKKAQLYEQLNRIYLHTVEALASAIDAKDPYTYGHSRRVADYAAIMCRDLNLSKEESKNIELASVLHDIGKIGTPEAILQKPYRLMPSEIDIIKEHPVLGAQILCAIDGLKEVIGGIRHHHERFDGNGYPDGKASHDIPIQARIIAIADCFDAMTSSRPYRKSMAPETAIAIMEDCAGSQFDPHLFAIFKIASVTHGFKAIYRNIQILE